MVEKLILPVRYPRHSHAPEKNQSTEADAKPNGQFQTSAHLTNLIDHSGYGEHLKTSQPECQVAASK